MDSNGIGKLFTKMHSTSKKDETLIELYNLTLHCNHHVIIKSHSLFTRSVIKTIPQMYSFTMVIIGRAILIPFFVVFDLELFE